VDKLSKYCAICGHELSELRKQRDMKYCEACGGIFDGPTGSMGKGGKIKSASAVDK
jgi:hypothetical protein